MSGSRDAREFITQVHSSKSSASRWYSYEYDMQRVGTVLYAAASISIKIARVKIYLFPLFEDEGAS